MRYCKLFYSKWKALRPLQRAPRESLSKQVGRGRFSEYVTETPFRASKKSRDDFRGTRCSDRFDVDMSMLWCYPLKLKQKRSIFPDPFPSLEPPHLFTLTLPSPSLEGSCNRTQPWETKYFYYCNFLPHSP